MLTATEVKQLAAAYAVDRHNNDLADQPEEFCDQADTLLKDWPDTDDGDWNKRINHLIALALEV